MTIQAGPATRLLVVLKGAFEARRREEGYRSSLWMRPEQTPSRLMLH
ncbi:hypothetical protein [Mesorhizobium tianshanense]|nr:hypothetical protein [Mesorhizobium tianshanense]